MSIEKIEPTVIDEELLDPNVEFDDDEKAEKVTRNVTLAKKPLFSTLLQRTAEQIWPNDAVVHDFVEFVATPLSEKFAHVTAKGGDFVRQQFQADKAETEVERYKNDQSMRAHLVNGLFPVLHIAKQLQIWNAPQFRYYDDTARRVFLASYVLHDYVKLPDVKVQLEAVDLTHDSLDPAQY